MLRTTLNDVRAHRPCKDGWTKHLVHLNKTKADDEPILLESILSYNGLLDTVWCLRCIPNTLHICVQYACFCAEQVLHIYEEQYPSDDRPRKAIEAARTALKTNTAEHTTTHAARGAAPAAHSAAIAAYSAENAANTAVNTTEAATVVHKVAEYTMCAVAAAIEADSNIMPVLTEEFRRVCRGAYPYEVDCAQP